MNSLAPSYLNSIKLSTQEASALHALGEFRGRQELYRRQAPELLDALKEAAIAESGESSNRIEGVFAPHPRIEALVLKSAAPQNRCEQEMAGYRDALNLIHESAVNMTVSVNVILQLHTMLFRYRTGVLSKWKMTQNVGVPLS